MTSKDRNELPSGRCCVKCRCGFEREEDRMCHNSKCECHTPASEKKRCQCDCHEVGAEVLECEKCHQHHKPDTEGKCCPRPIKYQKTGQRAICNNCGKSWTEGHSLEHSSKIPLKADTPSADAWEADLKWHKTLHTGNCYCSTDERCNYETRLIAFISHLMEKARSDGYRKGVVANAIALDKELIAALKAAKVGDPLKDILDDRFKEGRAAALQEVREIVEKMREEKSIDRGWHDEEYSKALSDLLSRLTEI